MAAAIIAGLVQHKDDGGDDLAETVLTNIKSFRVAQMPDKSVYIFSGDVLKFPFYKRGGLGDKIVFCALTEDRLFMAADENADFALDWIPLVEVESIDASVRSRSDIQEGAADARHLPQNSFAIKTIQSGHNAGRTYEFQASTAEKHSEWLKHLIACRNMAQCNDESKFTCLDRLQIRAVKIHDHESFQQFFGCVICSSFLISIVRSEMVPPDDSDATNVFEAFDVVFTSLFAVELVVSFTAHFFFKFFKDAWRIFDTLIVLLGILSASGAQIPAVNAIRALRVLRALRLLKKSKSLKPIVQALFASIGPVLNSMVLLGLITSIYASMAVGLFGDNSPRNFGKFSRAMFSMFQVCTGDGWATDITRPMFDQTTGEISTVPALFFVSYMLVCSLVLINIIIAVLLDEFLTTMAKSRKENADADLVDGPQCGHFLDPLMEVLSKFNSVADLSESINLIFSRLDGDGSGTIGFSEMSDGLHGLIPNVYLSLENMLELKKSLDPKLVSIVVREDLVKMRIQETCASIGYEERYLVLTSKSLDYYMNRKAYLDKPKGRAPEGSIAIQTLKVTPASPNGIDKSSDGYLFTIESTSTGEVLEFACEDAVGRNAWVHNIQLFLREAAWVDVSGEGVIEKEDLQVGMRRSHPNFNLDGRDNRASREEPFGGTRVDVAGSHFGAARAKGKTVDPKVTAAAEDARRSPSSHSGTPKSDMSYRGLKGARWTEPPTTSTPIAQHSQFAAIASDFELNVHEFYALCVTYLKEYLLRESNRESNSHTEAARLLLITKYFMIRMGGDTEAADYAAERKEAAESNMPKKAVKNSFVRDACGEQDSKERHNASARSAGGGGVGEAGNLMGSVQELNSKMGYLNTRVDALQELLLDKFTFIESKFASFESLLLNNHGSLSSRGKATEAGITVSDKPVQHKDDAPSCDRILNLSLAPEEITPELVDREISGSDSPWRVRRVVLSPGTGEDHAFRPIDDRPMGPMDRSKPLYDARSEILQLASLRTANSPRIPDYSCPFVLDPTRSPQVIPEKLIVSPSALQAQSSTVVKVTSSPGDSDENLNCHGTFIEDMSSNSLSQSVEEARRHLSVSRQEIRLGSESREQVRSLHRSNGSVQKYVADSEQRESLNTDSCEINTLEKQIRELKQALDTSNSALHISNSEKKRISQELAKQKVSLKMLLTDQAHPGQGEHHKSRTSSTPSSKLDGKTDKEKQNKSAILE
jgi:hypothetical protein